jgi:hypothetical protein
MKWIGIGAGAGLLVGTTAGGNAFLDTIVGGGTGTLYNQMHARGAGDVRLKEGTELGIQLDRAFALPAR